MTEEERDYAKHIQDPYFKTSWEIVKLKKQIISIEMILKNIQKTLEDLCVKISKS